MAALSRLQDQFAVEHHNSNMVHFSGVLMQKCAQAFLGVNQLDAQRMMCRRAFNVVIAWLITRKVALMYRVHQCLMNPGSTGSQH